MSAPVETIEVKKDEAGMRLDRWFRARFPSVGHSYLQKLLRSGQVRVDSRRVQANERLEAGAQVRVPTVVREPPKAKPSLTPPPGLSKADRDFIERMILFEDDDVLVLNKPYGIAVQGGTGTRRHIDGLLAGMVDRFGDRPRLVHRLDRDTTGVLLVAKHREAAARLGFSHVLLYLSHDGQKPYISRGDWLEDLFEAISRPFAPDGHAFAEAHLLDIGGGSPIASAFADAPPRNPLNPFDNGRNPERESLVRLIASLELSIQDLARPAYEHQRSIAD